MNIKILALTLFLTSFFISTQSKAFDCDKILTKTEKLICKNYSTKKTDEDFNLTYKDTINGLSDEDKEALKNKINNLRSARDLCIKSSQEYFNSKKLSKKFSSYHNELNELNFKLNKENYAEGCIVTWYNSISKALTSQKDFGLFRVPSAKEYLEEFNKIKVKPYYFEFTDNADYKNDSTFKNEFYADITYTIFFPNNGKNFIKIDKNYFSYFAGAAHGNSIGSINFITEKGETEKISNSSYSCSLPVDDPIIINGNIYLPEQISFTKFFNGMLGEFNKFQPYASSRSYNADCLMRISRIDNDKDAYIVFNDNDFLEDLVFNKKEIFQEDLSRCALDAIKKNQIDVSEIRKIEGLIYVPFVTIAKESDAELILNAIKKDCKKNKL